MSAKHSTPLTDLAQGHSNKKWVAQEFLTALRAIPSTHIMFGELESGKLKAPMSHSDGRKLTWQTKLATMVENIVNSPSSRSDCWLVPCDESHYHTIKMSTTGSLGKFRAHKVVKAVFDVNTYDNAKDDETKSQLCHRCSAGYGEIKKDLVCINPYHTYYQTAKFNQRMKGCKFACAATCPHEVKCIFTWRQEELNAMTDMKAEEKAPYLGKPKACYNVTPLPSLCSHTPTCRHIMTPEDRKDEKVETPPTTPSATSSSKKDTTRRYAMDMSDAIMASYSTSTTTTSSSTSASTGSKRLRKED